MRWYIGLCDWLSESTTILLCYGCDPQAKNLDGFSPLDFAEILGHAQIVLSSWWYACRLLRPSLWQAPSSLSTRTAKSFKNLKNHIRKRRGYTFDNDCQMLEANTECKASREYKMPVNRNICDEKIFEISVCSESCRLEWPIAWRLWVHRDIRAHAQTKSYPPTSLDLLSCSSGSTYSSGKTRIGKRKLGIPDALS